MPPPSVLARACWTPGAARAERVSLRPAGGPWSAGLMPRRRCSPSPARVPDGAFQRGYLEALPYTDATFAVILAADVLPYVADPLATLRELRRVCVPRGRVVIALCAGQGV